MCCIRKKRQNITWCRRQLAMKEFEELSNLKSQSQFISYILLNSIKRLYCIKATVEKMARSIDWFFKKVFVREELDLSTHSGEFFLSWKRQFKNFIIELAIKAEEIPWETKMAAIESCVTSATFEKITAAQLQLPREQR